MSIGRSSRLSEYPPDEEIDAIFKQCSNTGRWGVADETGTLNLITADKRRTASTLVREGVVVSIGRQISTERTSVNRNPATHLMLSSGWRPSVALDWLGIGCHGFAVTHLDALSHVAHGDSVYNARRADAVVTASGLAHGDIAALRDGVFTRGVLLDVAAARGVDWLTAGQFVEADDLDLAEERAGVRVEAGDAVVVHIGLERREQALGPEDPGQRAGLAPDVLVWLYERDVALYTGDCMDRLPCTSERFPLPFHEIALVSMGLVMLDCPMLAPLVEYCRSAGRYEFLLTLAPLVLPGGTGSPVNPLCIL